MQNKNIYQNIDQLPLVLRVDDLMPILSFHMHSACP